MTTKKRRIRVRGMPMHPTVRHGEKVWSIACYCKDEHRADRVTYSEDCTCVVVPGGESGPGKSSLNPRSARSRRLTVLSNYVTVHRQVEP
jgi:hypothetical protein